MSKLVRVYARGVGGPLTHSRTLSETTISATITTVGNLFSGLILVVGQFVSRRIKCFGRRTICESSDKMLCVRFTFRLLSAQLRMYSAFVDNK